MSKNRLDFTANLGRHSHDVTAGFTSSLTTGCIVPQYFDVLNPGDKIFFKTHMFCRSQKVVTAFLGEIDLHLDYFFVPMQMLYTAFGQVFAGTNDFLSDFYVEYDSGSDDSLLPVLDLNEYFGRYPEDLSVQVNPYCYESFKKGAFRLLDSLNYNPLVVQTFDYDEQHITLPHKVFAGFPSALLAYHAIYQKFFRNDEFEKFDVSQFNCDSLSLVASKIFPDSSIKKLLTLHYSGRPNDYFTNVRFSPIATSVNTLNMVADGGVHVQNGGPVSAFGTLITRVSNFLGPSSTDLRSSAVNRDVSNSPNYSADFGSIRLTNDGGAIGEREFTRFTAQNIRALFALDKYMRVYGRAGKTYDDQILAHFGVKVPHDVKHDLTHIKHYRLVLQSDPVISTADTDTGSVGSIGGQVAAQLDTDEISFNAPVHGVFMCVARLIPRPRYFGTNDRLHNISGRYQFPIPEFDKLGAQPLYSLEYGYGYEDHGGLWKNRYSEYKEKYNRVSMTFAHHLSANQGANFFSPWVVSQFPYGNNAYNTLFMNTAAKFVQPDALDNIMESKYSNTFPTDETMRTNPHIVLQTDPFLTEYCCFVKKVSWMSPTGEPDL